MNNVEKPWYKRWQVWLGIIVALGLLGKILPEPPQEKSEAKEVAKAPDEQQDKNKASIVKDEEKSQKDAEITKDKESKPSEIKPLTKEEVLNKFTIDPDIDPYIDGPYIFVDGETDTADYYALADTDRYKNASVIFKDGQIARVKFIPLNDVKAEDLLIEFGITEKPRKLRGMAGFHEIALISKYWSQNIERSPFELD
ncbi:hypothetical protein B1B04_02755 [Lysinibacillus sp. KCTC 33748]|uniref:hypothetical protein n=1 Tax=unclassified Lysinibacillus TaxID=2636778 RepID=UPI0009A65EEB|nr:MULTISPECIES: hypothetical protein [unclassified Lysinibacillus]OXS75936.1 hypothetical protein B1B04_02755 [Lysinibacillus sp. KCTC 33748]SKB36796.1 hypothetical protein SAMN06295926_1024 [Lysinibacillus sp. AC-3]